MTFAYGKQATEKVAIGFALKKITNTIDVLSQSFMAIDASMFSKVSNNYRVAVNNAVTQNPSNSNDRLPLTIKVGNAYSLLNNRVVLAADITSSQ